MVNSLKIETIDLLKEYRQGDQIVTALNSINFSVTSGEFIGITGRSGSGKSTLLNILAGLTLPTSGNVLLDKKDIFSLDDKELSLYRNATIGCVPQQYSLLSNLTVLDNVRLPFHLAKREGDSIKAAQKLLKLVGLDKLAGRLPKRLSGGQLKRVVIARALMNNPKFLLADEPTGDLDTQTTEEVMAIFRKVVKEGTGIIMVTHDVDTTAYGDKHFVMDSGELSN